jgi:protein SCO1/2
MICTGWRRWSRAALAAAAVLCAGATSGAATPWGADYFPNVPVTTQDGRTLRFYDDLLKGKSVAVLLFYTSCKDVCPLETANLVKVQKLFGERMGRDIFFYSIAIDPWDTPRENKAYAQKFGVGPGWLFLSGKEADIQLIARKLGLSRSFDAATRDGHAASLMVGNVAKGTWMRNSPMDNPQFLATTIANFLGWKREGATPSYAEARPLTGSKSQYLFQSRCSACHTIGEGDRVGPDLLGVTSRRERAWLARYLAEPEQVLAEGDPIATRLFARYNQVRMPNLDLGRDEIASLLAYLEARSRR